MRRDGLGIEHYQLVGAAEERNWTQVRVVVPINEQELSMRGMLAAVVRVRDEEEAAGVGVEMLQQLVEKFQTEVGMSRWEWVQQAAKWLEEKVGEGVVAVVVPVKGRRAVYMAGAGGMIAEIEREERKVLWGKGQQKAISGWLQEEDELLLATETFYDEVWSELEVEKGEEKVEEAGTRVTSSKMGSLMAGVVLEVGEWQKETGKKEEKGQEKKVGGEVVKRKREKKSRKSWLNLRNKRRSAVKLFKANRREWSLRIGVVFLVIFVISVAVGAWQKSKRERLADYREVAEPIEYNLQEAEKLQEVNPVRARSLVVEVQGMVEEQEGRFEEGAQAKKWDELVRKVEKRWQQVSGERDLVVKEWFDLSVVTEGVEVEEMVVAEDSLWVKDRGENLLVVNLGDKSSQVVAGEEVMGGSRAIGEWGEIGLVGKGGGIWQVEKESGEAKKAVGVEGVKLVDVAGYANNIYMLAEEGVFKYPGVEEGFGRRRRYLGAGEEVTVGQVKEMEIDGDIWVLGEGGEIERLSRGQKTSFAFQGMVEGWGEVSGLMTDEEKGKVWVWDKGRGVIVEFDREGGQYQYQWKSDELKQMRVVEWDGQRERWIGAKGSQLWVMERKE